MKYKGREILPPRGGWRVFIGVSMLVVVFGVYATVQLAVALFKPEPPPADVNWVCYVDGPKADCY